MLERVCQAGHQRHLCPSVLTFTPHPRTFFAQQQPDRIKPVLAINSLRDRLSLLAQSGIKQIALLRFDQQMASMAPATFVEQLLIEQLKVRWLLVGEDFKFGHKRAGDIDLLQRYAQRGDFELSTLDDVDDAQGQRISSSNVRHALQAGDMALAQSLLGRAFCMSGHVVHGQKLGRTLGFPTLNIAVAQNSCARIGIYVVRVHGLEPEPIQAVASLGLRPTVTDSGRLLLEVHLIDRSLNAYGKLVCVEFLQFLRDEQKFTDLLTLTQAMQNDTLQARQYFAHDGL